MGNSAGSKPPESPDGKVWMDWMVKLIIAILCGKGGVDILWETIDDVSKVATDTSSGLGSVNFSVVKDTHHSISTRGKAAKISNSSS